ncbi:hypothetical protein B0H63DRAFT_49783 [Podospora didyma]|uniref:Uncharacterized protein n=1 Tax=Podospora didyma TaxID=330526 RepID=A0AAE0P732_9PEZI|nr:hypothetical protein B0H63DRAFT_49783 [Podospora didyma]
MLQKGKYRPGTSPSSPSSTLDPGHIHILPTLTWLHWRLFAAHYHLLSFFFFFGQFTLHPDHLRQTSPVSPRARSPCRAARSTSPHRVQRRPAHNAVHDPVGPMTKWGRALLSRSRTMAAAAVPIFLVFLCKVPPDAQVKCKGKAPFASAGQDRKHYIMPAMPTQHHELRNLRLCRPQTLQRCLPV